MEELFSFPRIGLFVLHVRGAALEYVLRLLAVVKRNLSTALWGARCGFSLKRASVGRADMQPTSSRGFQESAKENMTQAVALWIEVKRKYACVRARLLGSSAQKALLARGAPVAPWNTYERGTFPVHYLISNSAHLHFVSDTLPEPVVGST